MERDGKRDIVRGCVWRRRESDGTTDFTSRGADSLEQDGGVAAAHKQTGQLNLEALVPAA